MSRPSIVRFPVLAASLAETEDARYLELLTCNGFDQSAGIWLLQPMRAFFGDAAGRGSAIVVLWGD